MKADLIIPTYRPDETFCLLLQKLQEQTFVVHRVIILNTEENLWKEAVEKYPIEQSLCGLPCEYTLYHVSKETFDHGGTRMYGAKHSDADVVIFMTQDSASKKFIDYKIDIEGLPNEMVVCDPVRVQEILINLLSNAIKYTPEHRLIIFPHI